jgi:hypothetical protein
LADLRSNRISPFALSLCRGKKNAKALITSVFPFGAEIFVYFFGYIYKTKENGVLPNAKYKYNRNNRNAVRRSTLFSFQIKRFILYDAITYIHILFINMCSKGHDGKLENVFHPKNYTKVEGIVRFFV